MRGTPYRFDDLTGGVNFKDAAYLLDSKQARDCLNVTARRGAVRRRDGETGLHAQTMSPAARGMSAHTVGTPRLVFNGPGFLRAIDTAGATVVQASGSFGSMSFASAPANGGQGPLYACDGTNPRFFTGSAFGTWTAATGTLPVGGCLDYVSNRMVVSAIPADPSAVWASDVGNPRDWDTSDGGAWAVKFDPEDGDKVIGHSPLGPEVVVFKRNKVFVIYDMDTGANRRVSASVGASGAQSITETPYGVFFLADDGVWVTDGSKVERVSDQVDPLLDRIRTGTRADAQGVWFEDRFYLSIEVEMDGPTGPNRVLEYDPVNKAWWVHSLQVQSFAVWNRGNGLELYGATPGGVSRLFVPGVVGGFESYWKSAWHSFKTPFLRKRCRLAHFDGEGTFSVYAAKDFSPADSLIGQVDVSEVAGLFGGSGVFGGEGLFGAGQQVSESRALTPGVGRVWSLVVRSTGDFTVYSYTLNMDNRKD